MRSLGFFLLLLLLPLFASCLHRGSVVCGTHGSWSRRCKFSSSTSSSALCQGSFDDTLNTTGWGVLDIQCSSQGNEEQNREKMFAAGKLECSLTAPRIWEMFRAMNDVFFGSANASHSQKLTDFLTEQEEWTSDMIQKNPKDQFWKTAELVLLQFEGCVHGYTTSSFGLKNPLPRFAFQLLNGVGDFLDLLPALHPNTHGKIRVKAGGMCSALIKVTGDMSDMFMAHSSWFTFIATNRIFKHYNFGLVNVPSSRLTFSSYPGFLESLDDFYILPDQKLVMLQTSLGLYNTSLYSSVVPQSLFAWQRVRIANHLARGGKEWSENLAKFNSGTYENQYMVIDNKLFSPGQPLVPDTLWVCEQIPTLVVSRDVTDVLRFGYFASYNVPYFPEIYKLSGFEQQAKTDITVSWQMAPRARLFRRDANSVSSLEQMKDIMRYNDFLNDPYENKNPYWAICSRGDLTSSSPSPNGCYDSKVTKFSWVESATAEAINGPTQSHNLPAFKWSGFPNTFHEGLPAVYNFTFQRMKPKQFF